MSNSGFKKKNLEFEKQIDKRDKNYSNLVEKYNQLKEENQNLLDERKILKDLIIENTKKNYQISLIEENSLKDSHKNSFYFQLLIVYYILVEIRGVGLKIG
jgi:hypothetical protein